MTTENYLFESNCIDENLSKKSGIIFRPLSMSDYKKGFCKILGELTSCDTNEQKFIEIFGKLKEINKINPEYYIVVGEDEDTGQIVAAGSVIMEQKFIHDGQSVGHIEDIVVSNDYRGKGLGENLIAILKNIAVTNCYKVILDCDRKNLGFYEKCGFEEKSLGMAKYF